jgi:hypothetical protein
MSKTLSEVVEKAAVDSNNESLNPLPVVSMYKKEEAKMHDKKAQLTPSNDSDLLSLISAG